MSVGCGCGCQGGRGG